jgi:excinuclease ABC subunit A
LAAGAIRGWDRRNQYYFQLITSLAEHYGFDIDTPFEELSADIRDLILYGSRGEAIEFSYLDPRGKVQRRLHPFEGVLPNMERRYRETDSAIIREELARYLSDQACQ